MIFSALLLGYDFGSRIVIELQSVPIRVHCRIKLQKKRIHKNSLGMMMMMLMTMSNGSGSGSHPHTRSLFTSRLQLETHCSLE